VGLHRCADTIRNIEFVVARSEVADNLADPGKTLGVAHGVDRHTAPRPGDRIVLVHHLVVVSSAVGGAVAHIQVQRPAGL